MMANWQHCPEVERTPGKAGSAWAFKGTEVPLHRLYECLASDGTVNDFAERFGVAAKRAAAVLEFEADDLHDYRLDYPGPVPFARNPHAHLNGPDDALWRNCPLVEQDPGILGGVWVFKRSRFTLYTIYENMASGATVNDLGEWYCIEKHKVVAVLQHQANALREGGRAYVDTV